MSENEGWIGIELIKRRQVGLQQQRWWGGDVMSDSGVGEIK